MAFDYMKAAGEVLSKTGNGGDAFEVFCQMQLAVPAHESYYQAVREMQDRLKGMKGMPGDFCTEAFRRALGRRSELVGARRDAPIPAHPRNLDHPLTP